MSIHPSLESVGQLFGNNNIFRVPRYQRYYSWGYDEISDFLGDLNLCINGRMAGLRREHFFGGLVTVRIPVAGTSRPNMEVIDGQQRLASFSMLVAQLRYAAIELAATVDQTAENNPHQFLLEFAETLHTKYEIFHDKVNLQVKKIERLELSKPDITFFKELIARGNPPVLRTSHARLKQAWDRIGLWLRERVVAAPTDKQKAELLSLVDTVIDSDWILIHMVTDSTAEAYRLFRVLNDRGTGLTEGELMRAQLLEAIDGIASPAQLQKVEETWDEILAAEPEVVEQQLRTVYASMTGLRAGKSTLLDDFLSKVFSELATLPLTPADVTPVVVKVVALHNDIKLLSKLLGGEWPYASSTSVTAWDKSRLGLLINELKHTNCLPLLLSATKLSEGNFAEVVQTLERFMFRYKVICNAHIGAATNVYHAAAVAIRSAPPAYQVSQLRAALQVLLTTKASDADFRIGLRSLKYSRDQSNKSLKYFLITLESYMRWHVTGAAGLPLCMDKMTVFDPSATTIEHVYAENTVPADPTLEPVLDTIGNLTLLGSADNNAAGNKPYAAKRPTFLASALQLNKLIAENADWTLIELQARQTQLEDAAIRIFKIA
jgi:Protein of unknown function DUF262/Protein of unknown function (DUF1524)